MAVYARQPRARPDSSEASPEAQVAAGEALAASGGWEVVHTFKDVGGSGWDPHRTGGSGGDPHAVRRRPSVLRAVHEAGDRGRPLRCRAWLIGPCRWSPVC
ncbi:recombinase family protein [Streptomyces sp. NBC_00691]